MKSAKVSLTTVWSRSIRSSWRDMRSSRRTSTGSGLPPLSGNRKAESAASVIAEIYGDEYPWVPWVSYTAAAGTGLSRINDEKHWASDVFLGAALGTAIGKLVVRNSPFLARHGLSLRPFHGDGASGIELSYRF